MPSLSDDEGTTITVRIAHALKSRLTEAMAKDRRSMTNFIVVALEERIDRVLAAPAPAVSARRR